jgi:hypothetical protein
MAAMNEATDNRDTYGARLVAFEDCVEGLRDSARYARLSGDPAADSLAAMVRVMESIAVAFRTRAAERAQISQSLRQEVEAISEAAIAKVEARGSDIVAKLLPRLTALTEQVMQRRLWVIRLRTLLLVGGVGFALSMAVFAVSYGAGYSSGRKDGLIASKVITSAMAADPRAAFAWAKLMAANDPVQASAICRQKTIKDAQGRRSCAMPVWLDPPPPPRATR